MKLVEQEIDKWKERVKVLENEIEYAKEQLETERSQQPEFKIKSKGSVKIKRIND